MRTKPAKKTGNFAPTGLQVAVVAPDHANEYDSFTADVIGENDSDSDDGHDADKGKQKRRSKNDQEEKPLSFMFFDFRK